MKYLYFLLLFYFTYSVSAKLNPEIDYVIYYKNSDSITIEFNYEFKSDSLKYVKMGANYFSNVVFEAEVKSNLSIEKYVWELNSIDNDITQSKLVFGVHSLNLPSSQYDIEVKYYQDNTPENFELTKFKIIPNHHNSTFLSDISFASIISHQDSTNVSWDKQFLKGNYFVVPNVTCQFFSNTAELLLYQEIYNSNISCKNALTLEYKILDATKRVKNASVMNIYELTDKSIPIVQSIPIQQLPTGVYFLEASVYCDNSEKAIFQTSKKFFYLNFDKAPELITRFTENELFEQSEFITMDEETIQREFDKLRYILSKSDLSLLENLGDLKAKQRALFSYWRNKDKDTTTFYNEAKEEFDRAVKYANQYFQYAPSIEGWRTERGRVLLKYGFPMVVEKYPRKGEQIPCEIWYYGEAGGGAYFYFVDSFGVGNYILAHSTIFGENQNEYWIEEYNPAVNFDQSIKRSSNYFKK